MPFDKPTRNLLAKMVAQCRDRLAEDIADQLQSSYGLHPDGTALDVAKTEGDRRAAEDLRALLAHFEVTAAGSAQVRRNAAYQQLVREIGFTTLNRLAALHLCEERGLVLECVRRGMASDGFQLYDRIAGGAPGNRYQTYRAFLESLFDELTLDLGVLFDRGTPQSHVFPSEAALTEVLAWLNDPELAAHDVWQQDETIGWVYQYYNDPKERKTMRDASQAPRNSRELAVRNQFFTPRYVVEFLTDNTLGRFWYEMRWGHTRLVDQCRYLVRRPCEIFLDSEYVQHDAHPGIQRALQGDFSQLPDGPTWNDLQTLALMIHGYDLAPALGLGECGEFANNRMSEYQGTGRWRGNSIGLWICLFFEQRRWHHFGYSPEGEDLATILALYAALREALANEQSKSDQEELLKQPVYIPPRDRKDPRDLKILDPACGSGHFLLYAFDLLTTIYEEAWGDPTIPLFTETGTRLADDYADLDALRRAIPGLILRHNLHGIDIDPRAVQIAALALWLRAQRTYQDLGLPPVERPRIAKTNLVTAEPMPGDCELLDEFVRDLRPRVLGDLVRVVFEKMELAGEAGSLLKIEEELEEAIAEAHRQWDAGSKAEQMLLFPEDRRPKPEQLPLFDVSGITDEAFWETAEERVLQALHDYATQAENGRETRRRLFAEDAAQGFAFVDLCRQKCDAVLMNPPFGNPNLAAKSYLHSRYPNSRHEIYGQFLLRAISWSTGYTGAITSRGFLYLANLADIRNSIYPFLSSFLDLGGNVLDSAFVEVCAFTLNISQNRTAVLCMDARDANLPSRQIEHIPSILLKELGYLAFDLTHLSALKTRPFCYDTPPSLLRMFSSKWTIETATNGIARVGLATGNNERFVRCYWEVPREAINFRWRWYAKGGEYLPFKPDVHLVVDWTDNGRIIEEAFVGARIRKSEVYFHPAVTYSLRSLKGLTFRILPEGCICSNKGPVIVSPGREYAILAIANSSPFKYFVKIQCSASAFEVGTIQKSPVPTSFADIEPTLEEYGKSLSAHYMSLAYCDETDVHFQWPYFWKDADSIDAMAVSLADYLETSQRESHKTLQSLDDFVLSAYEWPPQHKLEREYEQMLEAFNIENAHRLVCRLLLSVAVGCVMGEFPWNIAKRTPIEFDPYDLLPQGQFLSKSSHHVTGRNRVRDGILVDDPGLGEHPEPHPSDVVRRIREVLAVLWSENHDAIEAEACEILGVREVRDYFRKPTKFFAGHLKRYSKSRRKAPIYWPLSTPSGSYTLWLYYHRLDDQILYTAVNRYVTPKIEQVEGYVARLEADLAQATGRAASNRRDQLDQVRAFLAELREFRQELLRIAGLPYKPNLNDGVIINAAPLHRLFGLRKWAKDTEAVWRKLEKGEYDWAHMAYTLWPDRVREVCKHDRSIAIAHGLEELCEVPEKGAKKRGKRQKKRGQESQTELP